MPAAWIVFAYSTCLSVRFASLLSGEHPREDEQAVERRPELVAHVREELALVLGRERELRGLLLDGEARELDLVVLLLDGLVLLDEQRRLLLELLVDLLQLLLLLAQHLLGRTERLRLRLELLVRALQLVLLPLQLARLLLQLVGERLRLLEQLLGAHVRADHVEDDADALRELLEEDPVDLAERLEARELDDRAHVVLEEDGQDDDVQRRRLAEARTSTWM